MKQVLILLLSTFIIGCEQSNPNKKKIIDTGKFEIEVPANWKYKKERGIDSFVGRIIGDGVNLSFDLSEMGFANSLIEDEQEYIYANNTWMPTTIPYGETGVVYTTKENIEEERKSIMKKKGITDSSLVRVEELQTPSIEIIKNDSQYHALMTYKDTVVYVKIEIPEKIKNHLIQIDTIGGYKRKLVKPKKGEMGMIGVYLEDIESAFNFNLVGKNLTLENQERAINAFKTIKIKRS